jgi:hypothetical protein
MGFTKLDENIVESSIMAEDDSVFKIWIFLLAKCKEDGVARVSPAFIASVTHKPTEEILSAIKTLESPDPLSRTIDHEGRRIERVNGGFKVLNYNKYRKFLYSDSSEAIRQRKHREKRDTCDMSRMSRHGRDISASVSASSSASEDKRGMGGKGFKKPTVEEIKVYCLDRNNRIDPQYFFDKNESTGWVVGKNRTPMKDWRATIRTWEKFQKADSTEHKFVNTETLYAK